MLKKFIKDKSLWIIGLLLLLLIGLGIYFTIQLKEKQEIIDGIEYTDSTGTYSKVYFETKFKELKKQNKELYDSLKKYQDKIDYIVQFYHEKEYNTGIVNQKPKVVKEYIHDTVEVEKPLMAKLYEYESEKNDTFQYKLDINSYTEPNWFSLDVKVKNKFTLVNKEDNGTNLITIKPDNGGTITNPTVYKAKDKRGFWDRFSIGPSVTAGYDVVNKQWGIMAGGSITFDVK